MSKKYTTLKKDNPKTIFKYKILLFRDDKYIKSISFLKDLKFSHKKYESLLQESNKVSFPSDIIRDGDKYIKSQYYIKLVKRREVGDKPRIIRDELGKLIEEDILLNEWVVLRSDKYYIENQFYLFSIGKVDINYIGKYMVDGVKGRGKYKMVLKLRNQLFFYNEDEFDLIRCKTPKQCDELYHKLMINSIKSKVNGLIFNGDVDKSNSTFYYDLIQEETGWDRKFIMRHFDNSKIKRAIDC